MRTTSLCFLAIVATAITADAQTKRVVPAAWASTEGNSSTPFLFGYGSGRSQQIWTGDAITRSIAVIRSMAFRPDGAAANWPKRDLLKATIGLGVTKVAPTAMTTNWANNLTGKMTSVFSGTLNGPAQTTRVVPKPFNITFPMKAPFTYNKTAGNLAMEWMVPSQPSKSNYFLDAVLLNGTNPGGSITNIGKAGTFGDKTQPTLAGNVGTLKPGGQVDLAVGNLNKRYFGQLLFGFTDKAPGLPYDLGQINATGNSLYISIDAAFPFPARQAGPSWVHLFNRAIPNDNGLLGLSLFAQAYFGDPTANPLGLVVSQALKLGMPRAGGGVVTNTVSHWDSTSKTGFLNRTPSGPVVQFSGVLP